MPTGGKQGAASAILSRAREQFRAGGWKRFLTDFLADFGEALSLDFLFCYENHMDRDVRVTSVRSYSWRGSGDTLEPDLLLPGIIRYDREPFSEAESLLRQGQSVCQPADADATVALIPIHAATDWWGFLAAGPLPEESQLSQALLTLGASCLGAAVRESQLEARLHESERLRTLQRDLMLASGSDAPRNEALANLLALIAGTTGFASASVDLVLPAGLVTIATFGEPVHVDDLCDSCREELAVPPSDGPLYLDSAGLIHSGPCVLERSRHRAVGIVPLIHGGSLIGQLRLSTPHRSTTTDAGRALLETVAAEVSMLLAQFESDRQLRRTAERQRLASETGRVGIWEFDRGARRVILEPPADRLLELPTECDGSSPLPPEAAFQALPKATRDSISRWLASAKEQVQPLALESPIDGSTRCVFIRAGNVEGTDGSRSTVGTILDITDQKAASDAAKLLVEAQRDFMARMSHEFRTPLHAIQGHLQHVRRLLDTDPSSAISPGRSPDGQEAVNHALDGIKSASSHLLQLVENVLDQSRLESGWIAIQSQPTDLYAFIDSIRVTAGALEYRSGTRFTIAAVGEHPRTVMLDAARVRQVVYNLMANAATHAGGSSVSVRIRWIPSGRGGRDRIRFSVSDNGPGIPPDERGLVFLPYRGERSEGGSGLGLSISQELVQLMGSRIWLVSNLGEGTTFWFTLPCGDIQPAPPPETEPDTRLALSVIDAETLRSLAELAAIGDLAAIRDRLASIESRQDGLEQEFVRTLDSLAAQFRVREVQEYIANVTGER